MTTTPQQRLDADTPPRYSIVGTDVEEAAIFSPSSLLASLSRRPREIPSIYYYDDRGSALFERLCREPTYYLTLAELEILTGIGRDLAGLMDNPTLIELGCGNGAKTRCLLQQWLHAVGPARYVAIDANRSILAKAAETLRVSLGDSLHLQGFVATYEAGLAAVARLEGPKCLLFMGSNIGNMSDDEIAGFMSHVNLALRPADHFLVGIDLDKDSATLEAAYNNQTAILTNLCVLQHLNWRFNADFDLFKFRHVALHDKSQHRIESYLESQARQRIRLSKLDYSFTLEEGERIRTEISRKFVETEFLSLLRAHSFEPVRRWHDARERFAVHLLRKREERR